MIKNVEESKENLEKYKNNISSDSELKQKLELNKQKENNIKEEFSNLSKMIKTNKNLNKIILVFVVFFVKLLYHCSL